MDDLSIDCDIKRVEASHPDPTKNFEKPHQIKNGLLVQNGCQRERAGGVISTLGISIRVSRCTKRFLSLYFICKLNMWEE